MTDTRSSGEFEARVVFGLGAITGLALFFRLHGLNRSLWLDEAWVANSILSDSIGSMIRYPEWLQTTPPAFLLAVRGIVSVLPPSEPTLRLLPLLAGTTLVLLVWSAARQFLDPGQALVAALLIALSPGLVEYSRTLKPYVMDAWVGALALAVSARTLAGDERWGRWAALLIPLVLLSSYSAVLYLPGLFLAMASTCLSREGDSGEPATADVRLRGLRRCLTSTGGLALWVVGWGFAVYWLFVDPVRLDALNSYWDHRFAPLNTIHGFVAFQAQFGRAFVDTALPMIRPLIEPVVLAVAAGGLAVVATRRGWLSATILVAPALTAVCLNVLGLIPYSDRLLLGLIPPLVIAVAAGLDGLLACGLKRVRVPDAQRRSWQGVLVAIALVFGVRLAFVSSDTYLKVQPEEDARGAVEFLDAFGEDVDAVFVHASFAESFRFYTRSADLEHTYVFVGRAEAPCCSPSPAPMDTPESEIETFVRNVLTSQPARLAFVATGRKSHWSGTLPDSRELFASLLRDRDCILESRPGLRNVHLEIFHCPGLVSRERGFPPAGRSH